MAPLASTEDWADYTKIPEPANAAELLAAASGSIRNYCGWSISREVVTDEPIDTNGSGLILLPTLLLVSVEQISVGDTWLLERTDYRWSKKGMIRRYPYGTNWPRGFQEVYVSYTHGYETVPDEIRALTVGLAVRLTSAVPPNVAQKTVGAISITYSGTSQSLELDAGTMALLDAYALGVT